MSARTEKITFVGSSGGQLAARLDRPEGPALAWALFAHCFTCSKDIFAARQISRALTDLGFAVLRFDFTGLGASEGEFANTNFSSNVEDLVLAADHLRELGSPPQVLIGHSLGGAAVLAAAGKIPEVRAVATIGAPSDPGHVAHLLSGLAEEIHADGEAELSIGGRPFCVRRQFLADIAEAQLRPRIRELGKALLVLHAPGDQIVGIDNAGQIFGAARHPKSFVSLDDADHLLSRKQDASYAAGVIAAWASRYIEEAPEPAEPSALAEREVVVSSTGEGKYTQRVQAGRHILSADEPAAVGGLDLGPSPYEFLLAALGTCTAMTLQMYAARKSLPLQSVSVRLQHRKIHATDCEDCESTAGKVDEIERVVSIIGDLDTDQRKRLLEIADKCPVHRTLHSEIKVRSRLE